MTNLPPKPEFKLTDTSRVNWHLAAEIGRTQSDILLQIEWMIRHLKADVTFDDGKWWVETSARSLMKEWFKGAMSHETINANLDKLEAANLIIQKKGEKQGDKRLIALNTEGCLRLESVGFAVINRPSDFLTGDDEAVRKSDSSRQETGQSPVKKPDSEPSRNLTVAVKKSDGVLKESEDSRKEQKAAAASAAPNIFKHYMDNIGIPTPIIKDAIQDAVQEFSENWVNDAITEAALHGGRSWNYVSAILERWKREGRQAQRPQKNPSPSSAPPPPYATDEWFLEDGTPNAGGAFYKNERGHLVQSPTRLTPEQEARGLDIGFAAT